MIATLDRSGKPVSVAPPPARNARAGSIVLSLPPSVRLYVAMQPVNGRKGTDSLARVRRGEA